MSELIDPPALAFSSRGGSVRRRKTVAPQRGRRSHLPVGRTSHLWYELACSVSRLRVKHAPSVNF